MNKYAIFFGLVFLLVGLTTYANSSSYDFRSVFTSDLNHNFDFNGFVVESPFFLDDAWTPSGELDWNVNIGYGLYKPRITYGYTQGSANSWTIETWVKRNQGTMASYEIIASGWGSGYQSLIVYDGGNINLVNSGGGSTNIASSVFTDKTNWHHVVLEFTYDGALYDGNLWFDGTNYAFNNLATSYFDKDNVIVYWGKFRNSTNNEWNGWLDEARVFNTAKGQTYITNSYNSGVGTYGLSSESGLFAGYHFDERNGSTTLDYSGNARTNATFSGTHVFGHINKYPDNNLVAYYKFNEASGTTVYDSARGNNGVLTSGATINARGMWDSNAVDLDGANDYVSIADNDLLSFTDGAGNDKPFSISTWIKKDYEADARFGIATKFNTTAPLTNSEWILYYESTNVLVFYVTNPAFTAYLGRTTNNVSNIIGNWTHVVATYDGSETIGGLKIYINGVRSDTTNSSAGSYTGMTNGTLPVTIAPAYNGVYGKGQVDEFKIYNRELTQAEIVADYNNFLSARFVDANIVDAGSSADWNRIKINSDVNYDFGSELRSTDTRFFDSNLVGLYHLNNNALDSSGNGNNGTWSGSEAYVSGLWNTNAGDFDGSTDYVDTGVTGLLDGLTKATISVWVYPDSAGAGSNRMIFDNRHATQNLFSLLRSSSNNISFYINGTTIASNQTLPFDEWSHIVGVLDGTNKIIYINGVKDNSSVSSVTLSTATYSAKIGVNGAGTVQFFDGGIEEVGIWDKALTEQQVVDLYRKGATKLDLNVYSCSDASCNTKTSSQYITDANNNSWLSISSLTDSQYLGFDTYFKPITAIKDYNAGRFWVNSFLQDTNIEYQSAISTFDLNLSIIDGNNNQHLATVTIDSNDDTLDGVFSSPKLYSNVTSQDLNIIASKTGWDTNSIVVSLTEDKNATIILERTYYDINWVFKRASNGMDLNGVTSDFNLGLSGENYDQDLNTGQIVNMRFGDYNADFSLSGYDSNTDFSFSVDQDKTITIFLNKQAEITFYVRDSNSLVDLNTIGFDVNVGSSFDLVDQNSPFTQFFSNADYNAIFSVSGYDFNTVAWSVTSDADQNIFVYLDVILEPVITWINPVDLNTQNTVHVYFTVVQNDSYDVNDVDYFLNGVEADYNMDFYCSGIDSGLATCHFLDYRFVPFAWNDLNTCAYNSGGLNSCSDINFYYNPLLQATNISTTINTVTGGSSGVVTYPNVIEPDKKIDFEIIFPFGDTINFFYQLGEPVKNIVVVKNTGEKFISDLRITFDYGFGSVFGFPVDQNYSLGVGEEKEFEVYATVTEQNQSSFLKQGLMFVSYEGKNLQKELVLAEGGSPVRIGWVEWLFLPFNFFGFWVVLALGSLFVPNWLAIILIVVFVFVLWRKYRPVYYA